MSDDNCDDDDDKAMDQFLGWFAKGCMIIGLAAATAAILTILSVVRWIWIHS